MGKQRVLAVAGTVMFGVLATSLSGQHAPESGAVNKGDYGYAVQYDAMVTMRDDVKLATDVYLPAGSDGRALPGPWPVVLQRTPYGKRGAAANSPDGRHYATHGYAMVEQDVRGRYKSEGDFVPYAQEGPDGLDTFKWVMAQPWSNGKIAVTGSSYTAGAALAILGENPPGLAAAIIRVGGGNYHEDGAWRGGAFLLAHNVNFALALADDGYEATQSSAVKRALSAAARRDGPSFQQMLVSPLRAGQSPFALAPSYDKWYQDWQNHELYDEYWKTNGLSILEHYQNTADVPILLIDEWYDQFLGGAIDAFAAFGGRKSPVRLIVGPGEHGSVYSLGTVAGDVDMGQGSAIRTHTEIMDWFDQFMKGVDKDIPSGKSVRVFRIEGGNGSKTAAGHLRAGGTWQEFTDWPPQDAKPTKYYFAPTRDLTTTMPEAGQFTYTFDPADPVPAIAAAVSTGVPVQQGPADQRCSAKLPQCKGDVLPLNARPDVLSFSTPALTTDAEVTGAISVQLWISSTAVDTDFTAALIDQYPPTPDYPDGYAMNVQNGIVRARLRSFKQPGPGFRRSYGLLDQPLKPGEIYDVVVDLWSTSYLFKAGHRIRVDISSSSFPQFDVNPNTGEPFGARRQPPVVARNTIHMGGKTPSAITLPLREKH